jgi:hypothetical protein
VRRVEYVVIPPKGEPVDGWSAHRLPRIGDGGKFHTHPQLPPLERRDSVMQADRPPRRFAVCRKEPPNSEPSGGTITASSRRTLWCEAYGEPGAQAGPAVAADRPSSMGGEASSASGSPQLFVGQSSSAGSAPRITLVSQSCCFLPATASPASPACRQPAGRTSSCVGSGRPAAA